jgi:hypothetical protein
VATSALQLRAASRTVDHLDSSVGKRRKSFVVCVWGDRFGTFAEVANYPVQRVWSLPDRSPSTT